MKKYSFAVLSILFISGLMAVSPVAQADLDGNVDNIEQELYQKEQELRLREQELKEEFQKHERYRKLDQKKQALKEWEHQLNQKEKQLYKPKKDYGKQVGEKALSGLSNMGFAPFEIPKNIINTVNESNVALGVPGGAVKGILNTVGRFMSGLADVVTAPIITKPIIYPVNVWDDFDTDSTYGEAFRLDNQPKRFPDVSTCDIYLDPPCD